MKSSPALRILRGLEDPDARFDDLGPYPIPPDNGDPASVPASPSSHFTGGAGGGVSGDHASNPIQFAPPEGLS